MENRGAREALRKYDTEQVPEGVRGKAGSPWREWGNPFPGRATPVK